MEEKTEKQQDISKVPPQLQAHVFKKGQSGNLAGRPKGVTLKEYCRDFLSKQSDEERAEFLEGIPKESIWKMAEGNPDNKSELTGKDGQPLEIKVINYGANNNTPQLPTKEVPNTDIQSD